MKSNPWPGILKTEGIKQIPFKGQLELLMIWLRSTTHTPCLFLYTMAGHTEYINPAVSFIGSNTGFFQLSDAFYQGLYPYDGW